MQIEDARVLITGGAGFIGSHLADAYLDAGAELVVIFDRQGEEWPANIHHLKRDKRVVRVRGEAAHFGAVHNNIGFYRCNVVEHLAAELEVTKGIANVVRDAENNIEGTLGVLTAAKEQNVELLQYASSGAVYGRARSPHCESDVPEPHWPYGVSKLAGEQYCMQFHRLYGMNVNAFRYGIVYGPREWYGRVLTMFLKRVVLSNKPPIIYGDGKQTRDFVYVRDICDAHLKALKQKKSGQILNLGSENGRSLKLLVDWILTLTGTRKRLRPLYIDVPEGQAPAEQPGRIRLQGEIFDFQLDCQQARQRLGWEATTELNDGLKAEIAWLRKNPRAWDYPPKV